MAHVGAQPSIGTLESIDERGIYQVRYNNGQVVKHLRTDIHKTKACLKDICVSDSVKDINRTQRVGTVLSIDERGYYKVRYAGLGAAYHLHQDIQKQESCLDDICESNKVAEVKSKRP